MIQIWQVPSECGPSNLVVLGLQFQKNGPLSLFLTVLTVHEIHKLIKL